MVEGGGGGGAENSTHLMQGIILCDLEGSGKAFLCGAGVQQGGTVGEGREDDGMEDMLPIHVRDSPNGVAEHTEGEHGRMGMHGEHGDVVFPCEAVIQEDAEVVDRVMGVSTGTWGPRVRSDRGKSWEPAHRCTLTCDCLRLVTFRCLLGRSITSSSCTWFYCSTTVPS